MNNVKIYTPKDSTWVNATGDAVPFKFVPPTDKAKEILAGKVLNASIKIEADLKAFYEMLSRAFAEINLMVKKEYELKNGKPKGGKGSITWFNFDRSIKVEADVNEIAKWDNALMTEALTLLNTYLSQNMTDANELISGLVSSAFANTKGMIDTGKVFQILKYEDKIKHKSFQKACDLIKQAQSIDKTKLYMRVWEKGEDGSYRNINLNFSSL